MSFRVTETLPQLTSFCANSKHVGLRDTLIMHELRLCVCAANSLQPSYCWLDRHCQVVLDIAAELDRTRITESLTVCFEEEMAMVTRIVR